MDSVFVSIMDAPFHGRVLGPKILGLQRLARISRISARGNILTRKTISRLLNLR